MAWKIAAKNETEAEIILFDDIGKWWGGKSAKDFVKEIKDLGDITKINLRINSGGGDVFEAQAMYSYLRTHKAHKTVRIDGLAASAASFLAMAGDKIVMPSNALMMIHNPATIVWGEAEEMRKVAEFLDKVRDTIAAVYMAKTGLPEEKIKSMMDDETWMDADEALSLGFCDETDDAIEIAASARSLTDGDIAWRTAAGVAQFSRALGAKMPEAAKKVPLTLETAQNITKPKEEPILDIKNAADLEKEYPQIVKEVRDAADEAAYARGVEAERARLRALDGLAGPGRDAIIAKAKYEEPKDARDIAVELLQATNNAEALADRRLDAAATDAALQPSAALTSQEAIDAAAGRVADEINEMRGYKK
ncbi:MAG: Clp protease ClpP [Synergistaceae bacterium]|jgi:ATP-dependent protease ClpP protease subunit|nr:Clp protease ClpP [Synergistaceae bacterium]